MATVEIAEHWRIIAWILGIVFIAGGMAFTVKRVTSDVKDLKASLENGIKSKVTETHTIVERQEREIAKVFDKVDGLDRNVARLEAQVSSRPCMIGTADCPVAKKPDTEI